MFPLVLSLLKYLHVIMAKIFGNWQPSAMADTSRNSTVIACDHGCYTFFTTREKRLSFYCELLEGFDGTLILLKVYCFYFQSVPSDCDYLIDIYVTEFGVL